MLLRHILYLKGYKYYYMIIDWFSLNWVKSEGNSSFVAQVYDSKYD